MYPAIRDGECLRVRPRSIAPLNTGCVILYRLHGRMAAHRAIQRNKRMDQWLVAADAAFCGGDWISDDDILGVAESVVRNGREVPLDTLRARWAGLLRYHTRPLRRLACAVLRRWNPPL